MPTRATILECELEDLQDYLDPFYKEQHEEMGRINAAFSHESILLPRIPDADTGEELYFQNREVLVRFSLMPVATQRGLLRAVRQEMKKHEVDEVRLRMPWSKARARTLVFKSANRRSIKIYVND